MFAARHSLQTLLLGQSTVFMSLMSITHSKAMNLEGDLADYTRSGTPMLRFGVLADVQYAEWDDAPAWYNPNKTRFYRNSLKQVEKAFEHWEKQADSDCPVSFILQLGDIIDALNTSTCSQSAIDRTLSCFLNNAKMPTFHTVGNHELYNFNRQQMSYLFDKYLFQHSHSEHSFGVKNPKTVSEDGSHPLYYKFYPMAGIKFISLDTYDISVLGHDESHSKYQMAANLLEQHHGHRDFELWDSDKMLVGPNKRFQSSNGALSKEQLAWLDSELTDSDLKNEVVIVFGHVGLHPKSCGWDSLLWNYEQVTDCFNAHSCVVSYFSGHAHNFGYALEKDIMYVTFHGIIETEPNTEAFATVTLFEDKMLVDGRGVEQQLLLQLKRTIRVASTSDDKSEDERDASFGECTEGSAIENLVEIEVEV